MEVPKKEEKAELLQAAVPIVGHKISCVQNSKIPTLIERRFRIKELIDKGGFGKIYSAVDNTTMEDVIIKIVSSLLNIYGQNAQKGVSDTEVKLLTLFRASNVKNSVKIISSGYLKESN